MMNPVEIRVDPDTHSAELTLPEGSCPICSGEMSVRASAAGAFAVCVHCKYVAKTALKAGEGTMEVSFLAAEA